MPQVVLLSYLGSHWVIILAVMLLVVALGAAALILKNLKYVLAALAVALVGFAYQAVDMEGYKRRVAEEHAAEVKELQKRLDISNAMSGEYQKRYAADQAELDKLKDQASETPANSSACLPRDAVGRLRRIH